MAGETCAGSSAVLVLISCCWNLSRFLGQRQLSSSWSAVSTSVTPGSSNSPGKIGNRQNYSQSVRFGKCGDVSWFVINNSEKSRKRIRWSFELLLSHFCYSGLMLDKCGKISSLIWQAVLLHTHTFEQSYKEERDKPIEYISASEQWTVMISKMVFFFLFLATSSGSKSPTPDDLLPELKVTKALTFAT